MTVLELNAEQLEQLKQAYLTRHLLETEHRVIVLPHYDIGLDRPDYWEARKQAKANVVVLAKKHDLYRTEDSIEDQGTHFYFVFRCGKSWMEEYFMKRLDNLEGCEDNPVYVDEIKKIRRQLGKIRTE